MAILKYLKINVKINLINLGFLIYKKFTIVNFL